MHVLRRILVYLLSYQAVAASNISTLNTKQNKKCSKKQLVKDIEIDWRYTITSDETQYYSIPLCIDKGGMYVLRKCENGRFGEEPECHTLQMTRYACMDGLQMDESTNGNAFCYTKSHAPIAYEQSIACPYKFVDPVVRTNYVEELSEKFPIWLDYHLEIRKKGFGNFVANRFLGTEYKPWEVNYINNSGHCLSMDKRIVDANCELLRYRVCIYRAIALYAEKETEDMLKEAEYCSLLKNGDHSAPCRMSWMSHTTIKCVCPKYTEDCRTPAVYPIGVDNFAIGLMINEENELIWTATNEVVQNTLWSIGDLKIRTDQDSYIIWSNGWAFAEQVTGIMCEIETSLDSVPTLTLSFDNAEKQLRIKEEYDKWIFSSSSYGIKCYQDLGFHLRKYPPHDSSALISGNWQCEAISLLDTETKIYSNKVYVQLSDFVYIVQLLGPPNESTTNDIIQYIMDALYFPRATINVIEYTHIYNEADGPKVDIVYRLEFPQESTVLLNYRDMFYTLKQNLAERFSYLRLRLFNLQFCDGKITYDNGNVLIWPAVDVGETSYTNCYDSTGIPLGAECELSTTSGLHADFSEIPRCDLFTKNISLDLSKLENADGPPEVILANLTIILQKEYNFTPSDFNKTANILEKFQGEAKVDDVLNVVSSLMSKNNETLYDSQRELNVTDRVLYALDVSLISEKTTKDHDLRKSDNIEVMLIDNKISNYSGCYLSSKGEMEILEKHLSIEDILMTKDLQSAAYIESPMSTGISSITMFRSSILFNENGCENGNKTNSHVFGVLLPENATNIVVNMIFPRQSSHNCAFWKYGNEAYGKWEFHRASHSVANFTVCIFQHTTHYGYLLFPEKILNKIDDMILSTMTTIECCLSIIGLVTILIIALIFPEWYRNNVKFLHYCMVLLVQTILLFINSYIEMPAWLCVTSGATLHFTVLSQFCWMVVIAIQKHRTLIKVFQRGNSFWETNWVMLYTYFVPFLIVGISVGINWESYIVSNHKGWDICYPHGHVLKFALITPMAAMTIFNGFIFIWVLHKLFCTKPLSAPANRDKSKQTCMIQSMPKILTILLMVFTLGITWWLGFAALVLENAILLYLFSITTALQGFLIFIFTIMAKKEVRSMIARKYSSNTW